MSDVGKNSIESMSMKTACSVRGGGSSAAVWGNCPQKPLWRSFWVTIDVETEAKIL